MCDTATIMKIAKCLKVPPGSLSYNNEKVVTRTTDNNKKTFSGFATILTSLAKESNEDIIKNGCMSQEVQCQVNQWIEYAVLYLEQGSKDKHVAQSLLRDLNEYLYTRSYFVNYAVTLADLAIFYTLYDLVKSLSANEKENYLNLSRWFNHMQQNDDIRQGADLINFTTIYLHFWATGTHV